MVLIGFLTFNTSPVHKSITIIKAREPPLNLQVRKKTARMKRTCLIANPK